MAAKKSKPKSADTEAQSDPKAPLDSAALLKAATPVLKNLAADLLKRADASASITAALQARHTADKAQERTADNYDTWRRDFVEQVAAAWFLSCVFVRTLEDRSLIDRNRLAGPGAEDSQRAFFALAPSLNERDYLLTVFRELQHLPAACDLFDARHNPVWLLGPSAEAAKDLLGLFRKPTADAPTFRFGNADSRFLGDLYQDLSENVRKRYALLQTPRFVERFILDRTLEPALLRFGLNETNLIDPTCGSGHFLLGAFDRLFDRRLQAEPGLDVRQAAVKALDAVAGSDVNPYAVAIAKFRLTLSFVEKAGYVRLKESPKLPLHVVVADSLLHNPHVGQQSLGDLMGQSAAAWKGAEFKLEDEAGARAVLHKQYAAVVGNPPYITVKDKALRDRYRKLYSTAFREYSLAVPFKERFFQLAKKRGYVGMITANSFMKREFGAKVIEEYLPTVNLETIINTAGAYIPGHGTPTVLLFGTAEKPQSETVLTVLGNRGEPSTPEDPEQGFVWSSIAQHWSDVGFENEYITVSKTERTNLAKHPWSLGGGGATELKALLEERAEKRLEEVVDSIGFMCITKQDDLFAQPLGVFSRLGISPSVVREFVIGEYVRDWNINSESEVFYPYGARASLVPFEKRSPEMRYLWPVKTVLESRAVFGGATFREFGRPWYEYGQIPADRQDGLVITFAEVATHNHFVLDRGGKVFKQTAPIIKLPATATEDNHLALLAYLNSSTACFWMKQVCHNKTNASQKHSTDPARATYAYSGTAIEPLPIFAGSTEVVNAAKKISALCEIRSKWLAGETFRAVPKSLESAKAFQAFLEHSWKRCYDELTEKCVYLQEELDWWFYEQAGLIPLGSAKVKLDADLSAPLGARPFEAAAGYQSGVSDRAKQNPDAKTSGTAAPAHWAVRHDLLTKEGIETIEARAFKRMWRDTEQNVDQQEFRNELPKEWLITYLLEKLEAAFVGTLPMTSLQLTGALDKTHLSTIAEVMDTPSDVLVESALRTQSVAFVAPLVFTDTGLEKRRAWEQTWGLQRREDARESVVEIPVPPEYSQGSRGKSTDFRENHYWSLRGKLDVPKERFISYPGCESDEDKAPVYGWAGWNHLQRAQALAQLYNSRREEGWGKERLQPMLAGLLELMPWLLQWHNEPSEELGGQRPGEQFSLFLEGQCAELGFTHEDLRAWRPSAKKARAKKAS